MSTPRQPMIATRFCLDCGYPLEKLAEPRCPECGKGFDPEDEKTFRYVAKKQRRHRLLWIWVVLLTLICIVTLFFEQSVGGASEPQTTTWMDVVGIALVALLGLCAWMALDARHVRKADADRDAILRQLDVDRLRAWYRHCMQSWRPVYLVARIVLRGGFQYNFALHLNELGLYDEALVWIDKAIAVARKRINAESRRLRAIILLGKGQQDDPRVAGELSGDPATPRQTRVDLRAWAALNRGELDEVVSMVPLMQKQADVLEVDMLRALAAHALLVKGCFEEALTFLDGPLVDGSALLRPYLIKWASTNPQVAREVDQARQRYSTFVAVRHGPLAVIALLMLGRLDDANARLNQIKPAINARPRWLATWEGLFAWCCAKEGHIDEARAHLATMADSARRLPGPLDQREPHVLAARCYLELGEPVEAKRHLEQALPLAVTPVQRHEVHFLLGCAEEALGDDAAAATWFEKVAADGIESVMARQAREKLAGAKK